MEVVSGDPVRLRAQPQGPLRSLAAQIQVAVPKPRLLADFDVLINLEGKGRSGVEDLGLLGEDLHLTGGQLGVLVAGGPALHRPGDPEHKLVAQRVEVLLIADDHLRHTGGVTQIQEGHSAVVAATGHPAAQGDSLTNEFGVDLAGGVSAEHSVLPKGLRWCWVVQGVIAQWW